MEKIALWRDVELKYSPKDLHKPYIIFKQKHIYYTFFHASLHEDPVLYQTSDILVRKSIEITWKL